MGETRLRRLIHARQRDLRTDLAAELRRRDSAEAFSMLDELAALLGGAVGVSRVATSLGWRPHAQQVGQTGTRIAPDLYIACWISGAIQHIVGCKAAKRILVINADPDAPIFSRAAYVVVGDVHTVVPAISGRPAFGRPGRTLMGRRAL